MTDLLLSVDSATFLPPADVRTAVAKDSLSGKAAVYTPEMYGAVGDGTADDEAAVRAAFTVANALVRPGFAGSIWHPGATVKLSRQYNMPNLATPIDVRCNVVSDATVKVPAGYAGVVLRVGHSTSGSIFQAASVQLPDVVAPSLTAGSVGVQIINLWSSDVRLSRVMSCEKGVWLTGLGHGTVYNRVHLGWLSINKISVELSPGAGGWVNQNTFIGGGVQQSGGTSRLSGYRHLVMDGAPGGTAVNAIDGNVFVGVSWEGDDSEYCFYLRHAHQNSFISNRHEPGTTTSRTVTVSGDTLTSGSAHNLAVGDMLILAGTTYPSNMVPGAPYYVHTVGSSTTFKLTKNKGGAAITWTGTGSGLSIYRPHRIYLDNTNSAHVLDNNLFTDRMSWPRPLEIVVPGAAVTDYGSVENTPDSLTLDTYSSDEAPAVKVRNRAGSTRPGVAAYPTTVSPKTDPDGWTTALSDRGVLFASSSAEKVKLTATSAGSLRTRLPGEGNDYEVPTCLRTQGGPVSITSLSCTANTTTTTTLTLTNVAVGDTVVATPTTDLATGLILAWARVSAANTVKVGFYNATGSTISLTTTVALCVTRQYF